MLQQQTAAARAAEGTAPAPTAGELDALLSPSEPVSAETTADLEPPQHHAGGVLEVRAAQRQRAGRRRMRAGRRAVAGAAASRCRGDNMFPALPCPAGGQGGGAQREGGGAEGGGAGARDGRGGAQGEARGTPWARAVRCACAQGPSSHGAARAAGRKGCARVCMEGISWRQIKCVHLHPRLVCLSLPSLPRCAALCLRQLLPSPRPAPAQGPRAGSARWHCTG